ncbi:MAG: hypothetical protein ABIK73_06600 [candidate division WOR-3 bacterium]
MAKKVRVILERESMKDPEIKKELDKIYRRAQRYFNSLLIPDEDIVLELAKETVELVQKMVDRRREIIFAYNKETRDWEMVRPAEDILGDKERAVLGDKILYALEELEVPVSRSQELVLWGILKMWFDKLNMLLYEKARERMKEGSYWALESDM